jgi:hypothetical protein
MLQLLTISILIGCKQSDSQSTNRTDDQKEEFQVPIGKWTSDDILDGLRTTDANIRADTIFWMGNNFQELEVKPDLQKELILELEKLYASEELETRAAEYIPRLLFELDQHRIASFLLTPKMLQLEHLRLLNTLRWLQAKGVKVPHEYLLPILKAGRENGRTERRLGDIPKGDLRAREQYFRRARLKQVYCSALKCYAVSPDENTEKWLRAEARNSDDLVSIAAASGLIRLAGLDDPHRVADSLKRKQGLEALTESQRVVWLLSVYNFYVGGGGHADFFGREASLYCDEIVSGLKEVGAPNQALLLTKVLNSIGPDGLADSIQGQRSQMQKLWSETEDVPFREVAREIKVPLEDIDTLVLLYALENPEDFKKETVE